MAVPKKKTSKGRTSRRHKKYLEKQRTKIGNGIVLADCSQCGERCKVHYVCEACGYYKGEQVIDKVSKALDKIKTIKA